MALTAEEIIDRLRPMGKESYKRVMLRHGAKEPLFGVSIGDMKPIQKQIKKDYQLALDLFDTGVYDAMYLAGLIADDAKMTPSDLQNWLNQSNCDAISNVTVAWVAAESPHGWDMGLKWIAEPDEKSKGAGWSTLSCWVALRPDSELDIPKLRELIHRVKNTIHSEPNDLRYSMNSFLISVGCYVLELTDEVKKVAELIGKIDVHLVGDCKLPGIAEYIKKVEDRGTLGKKRKTVKC